MMQEKEEEALGYMFPWPDTPQQSSNALFQSSLDNVYRTIYQLGTPATRQQMEELRLLSDIT